MGAETTVTQVPATPEDAAPPQQTPKEPSAMRSPSPSCAPEPYREWRVLAITTLTAIATLIGSGILAIPVTLYATPLSVFLILFTVVMLVQTTAVFAIVELLQRARGEPRAVAEHSGEPGSPSYESIPQSSRPPLVSLFSIADLYLPNVILRYIFYLATLFCFISILVSYGLAGPQAVWQLVSPDTQSSPPPGYLYIMYWSIGTFSVIFFIDQLLGVFGSFTVLKGGLFVGVVLIVALLPDAARVATLPSLLSEFSGWMGAASPFLMGCVALCGVSNTMPVTFNLLPARATRAQVARYRGAVLLGVLLCYLLNVGWVVAVLQVVPRMAADGKPSLTVAYQEGQISTVPLIDVLHAGGAVRGGVLRAIEVTIEMFILVSTGVSFFVSAAGMKSFVDGGAASAAARMPALRRAGFGWAPRLVAYVMSFGAVLVIIVMNPKGFITVLTRLSSLTLNVQSGVLLFVMLYYSRRAARRRGAGVSGVGEEEMGPPAKGRSIPLELGAFTTTMCMVVGLLFFTLASTLAAVGPLLGVKMSAGE